MLVPTSIAIGSVFLGWALGVFGRRESASRRTATALSTFAMVAALAVVLAQLLPDALAEVGLPALLVFGASVALPNLLGKLGARSQRDASGWGLELGYLGLVIHQAADGIGLGTYGGGAHADHGHFDVLFAIAAHTVPVVAVLTLTYSRERGVRSASLRALGLAAASVVGVFATTLVPASFHDFEPWVTAAVAGLLLHVVAHDFGKRAEPAGPKVRGERVIDLLAVGAGLLLVGLASGHDHGSGEVRHEMATALLSLSLATAPALLIGLGLGALLTTFGAQFLGASPTTGGVFAQALRGVTHGGALPISECGIVPLAASNRARGAGAAWVVAFLLSAPALGIETFALTARFIGWPFALVRLAAAVAIAIVAAWVVHRFARTAPQDPQDHFPDAISATPASFGSRLSANFDVLLYRVAPWTVAGLIAAAYVHVVLPGDGLIGLRGYGFDVLIVALVAVPGYLCAASSTPMAAVLLLEGMSPGAVLIGLLLGPAIHLAMVGFLRRSYGARAAFFAIGTLIALSAALAFAVNEVRLPIAIPPLDLGGSSRPDGLATIAGVLLALALLRSVWQAGLRAWLASLGESLGLSYTPAPGVAACGHDHTHAHDHDAHGHAVHDHASHDHDSHGHDSHDHDSHDHGSHDHGSHDHGSHDHDSHDHGSHDHGSHDHSSHDHGSHDHDSHDHDSHDHDSHDHDSHDHDSHDHGSHDHGSHDHDSHDHASHDLHASGPPHPDRAR